VLTTLVARAWLSERVVARQWLGLAFGLAGVLLRRPSESELHRRSGRARALGDCARRISIGTLYQKRYCSQVEPAQRRRDPSSPRVRCCTCRWCSCSKGKRFQVGAGIRLRPRLVGAGCCRSARSACSTGCCATAPQRRVARLFYMLPPVTALMAWAIFGETLDALAIAGMALIAVGVALARPAAGS
jgi:hypothetical protein